MTLAAVYRVLAWFLAGLLLIAQPGPCPCWLYTLWRFDAPVTVDAHAGHAGHDHPVPASTPTDEAPNGMPRSDGDTIRYGVQQPPIPAPAAALLANLAQRSIHWRLLRSSPAPVLSWRPDIEPPPPRRSI